MDNTVEVQELGKVMITPKGEYSLSKSYEILDAVSYNGSSYVSKINDNTSVPTSDDWQLLAQKGDIYDVTEEDLQAIAKQITDNANSAFNQNVKTKTKEFNTNATNKLNDYDTNAKSTTETFDANAKKKLDEYNANDTKKLKAYNDNADNKLSAYNTNDTNKLKAYNTNADSKIEEYNTNANSKILEYDKHSEELRNMAVSTDNELERVKNEILDTGSASDSFVHVEDSCMAKIKELEIDGIFQQDTTTGKNLFKPLNNKNNGIETSWNKDNIGTIKGTSTNIWANITGNVILSYPAGNYILSIDNTKTFNLNLKGTFTDGETFEFSILAGSKTKNVALKKETHSMYAYISGFQVGTTFNEKIKIQLEKGSTATSFELYTGGQPSPSPDYPQEIKTITNNLKITSCGRNLFDINKFKEKITGQGMVSSIDGSSIICNGTATTTYATIAVPKLSNVKLYPGEYMISVRNTLPYSFAFQTARQDGTRGPDVVLHENRKSEKFKVNELLTIASAFLSFMAARPTLTNFTISDIQIERANTVSEYENYVESLIKANLPKNEFIGKLNDTYKDTLTFEYVTDDSKCHLKLKKKIGKKVFKADDNWIRSNSNASVRFSIGTAEYATDGNYETDIPKFKSNYFQPNTFANIYLKNQPGISWWFNSEKKNWVFSFGNNMSLEEFKTFLSEHTVEAYYPLETPYELDLCPIDMPLSYKKITNIFTDNDLLPTINAKYYRTFQTTVQNLQINEKSLKQEITDLNNNISDITKRLEALESANVNTVEESEASNDLQN